MATTLERAIGRFLGAAGVQVQKAYIAATTVPDGYGARDDARKRRLDAQKVRDAQAADNLALQEDRNGAATREGEAQRDAYVKQGGKDMYGLNSHLTKAGPGREGLQGAELAQFKATAGIRETEVIGPRIMPNGTLRLTLGCPGEWRKQEAVRAAARGRR
jgi:hypothetical protein